MPLRGSRVPSDRAEPAAARHASAPRRLITGGAVLVGLLVAGAVGFMVAGLSPIDAAVSAVSAITTVGYFPGGPLSPAAKVFTMVLVLAGVGTGIYVLGSLTEFLIEGGVRGSWQQRRRRKQMDGLTDHYIISGFGRVGRRSAEQLRRKSDTPFVVVDTTPSAIAFAREAGYLYYEGDATRPAILEAVHIGRARGLLACADSDAINVYVTLTARSLNSSLYIVARTSEPDAEDRLLAAGASRVICPYTMAGNRMAHLAVQPLAADYIDIVIQGQNLGVQIEERLLPPGSPLGNRTVGDIRRKELAGAQILAMQHDNQLITSINDGLVVTPGDRILVAGTEPQLAHFDQAVAQI